MPEYLYKDPETGEEVSIYQGINEKHKYSADGKEFERVFTVPNASIDTNIDPMSEKDFVEKTRNKKGTLGEMWDASKEASEKRDKITGKDPTKEEYFKNYSKKRKGMKHPDQNKGRVFDI
tara:strand:- start:1816 stop:2175 length:360 start_codon:yes stop_codon:yes gene_type:complete